MTRVLSFQTSVHTLEKKKERRRWQERKEYQDRFCSSTEKDIVFHHFSFMGVVALSSEESMRMRQG
jgi:hypothetical protein